MIPRVRVLLAGLVLALAALAQEEPRPRNNNSYVPADNEAVARLVLEARQAAEAGDAQTAADRLQALLVTPERGLVALRDRLLYVSARRWAQLQLLSETPPFGRDVLDAWREVQGAQADAALGGAIAAGDEEGVLEIVGRCPAASAAPAALLLLADRAIERGDPDAARGLLLRVPEHLPRSEESAFLASDAFRARKSWLDALPPRPTPGWPTLGGDMTRARNGDPLAAPAELSLLWESAFLERLPETLLRCEEDSTREHSPVLPFYPVCDAERLYVHLGPCVAAFARAGGKLLWYAPEGAAPDEWQVDEMLARSPGVRAATVSDGVLYFARVLFDNAQRPLLANELVAFDVEHGRTLWRVRPGPPAHREGVLARGVFFRGAPAVDGRRLYVYGAIRDIGDDGPTRKEEALLFCFDRETGALLWSRLLGYGDTDAAAAFPPLSGLAPALAGGVVVAVTGLGVAASLDAATGDVLWLFRYDRQPVRERERLIEEGEEQKVHLGSGWMREAPRIAGDSVYFAPFDADEIFACWLRGARQPGQPLEVEQWAKDRARGHRHSLLEYIAGLYGGRIWYVGRRDERPSLTVSYQAVVSHPLDRGVGFAYGLLPQLARDSDRGPVPPEVYGRPMIAGGVLCLPTREVLFRFDAGHEPGTTVRDGERRTEIALLPAFVPPARDMEPGDEPPAAFGNLVAIDGVLYAVTGDRVIAYGKRP